MQFESAIQKCDQKTQSVGTRPLARDWAVAWAVAGTVQYDPPTSPKSVDKTMVRSETQPSNNKMSTQSCSQCHNQLGDGM